MLVQGGSRKQSFIDFADAKHRRANDINEGHQSTTKPNAVHGGSSATSMCAHLRDNETNCPRYNNHTWFGLGQFAPSKVYKYCLQYARTIKGGTDDGRTPSRFPLPLSHLRLRWDHWTAVRPSLIQSFIAFLYWRKSHSSLLLGPNHLLQHQYAGTSPVPPAIVDPSGAKYVSRRQRSAEDKRRKYNLAKQIEG